MADINESIETLKFKIQTCFKVLDKYSWLLDGYVLNFFTENHMDILSKSWKTSIQHISLREFQYVLNISSNISSNVWPLSVICLKVLVQNFSLNREIKEKEIALLFHSNKINFDLFNFSKFAHPPKLFSLFFKHVKPKKRYEILKMAELAYETAMKLKVNFVVDVGSGLGHLSRILAYGFHLKVCSIETQPQLIGQAEKLDCEFEKAAEKYLNADEIIRLKERRPIRWNETIKSDSRPNEFSSNLKSMFGEYGNSFKFGIVGLHPCGDLATTLLNLYVECDEARFINVVGCCYHKLSTSWDSTNYNGFPVSIYCLENKISLSYEARALGCHAVENYCERLNNNVHHHLKIHCYRAALECLIQKNWPEHRKKALGNVKASPDLTFEKYCAIALSKLNVKISEADWNSNEICQNLRRWEEVAKFYTFRLMLAPLIETIILLDRKLYLLEKGILSKILATFDPEVSPRNQLLISEK